MHNTSYPHSPPVKLLGNVAPRQRLSVEFMGFRQH